MCAPLPLMIAGAQAAAGAFSAYNQYKQGVSESKMLNYQRDSAQQQGALALSTGQKQSELIQDTAKIEGKQLKTNQAEFNASTRATMAANGVQGGTAEDITSSNLSKERLDELALKYNADTKSWETETNARNQNWTLQNEAKQYGMAAKNAKSAGKTAAFSTLLGTAASTAMGAYKLNLLKKSSG